MNIIRRGFTALDRIFRATTGSSVAWLVVVLHAAIFILCIANMSPPDRKFADSLERLYASGGWSSVTVYAGRPFHFYYESLPLKVIFVADLPAIAVAELSTYAIQSVICVRPTLYLQSWVDAVTHILFASLQWLILGYLLERYLVRRPRLARILSAVQRRRTIILVVIVVATLLATPLIQMRSNSVGFRHGGISFSR